MRSIIHNNDGTDTFIGCIKNYDVHNLINELHNFMEQKDYNNALITMNTLFNHVWQNKKLPAGWTEEKIIALIDEQVDIIDGNNHVYN